MAVRALAAFTFQEALRRRLVAAVALLSVAFLGLFALVEHVLSHGAGRGSTPIELAATRLASVFLGVYLARSFAGVLAILVSAGAISAEVESGAIQSVLARPVSRTAVVLGKFVGYGAMLLLYNVVLQGAVVAIGYAMSGARIPHALWIVGLLGVEPLVLLGATLVGSCFLPTLANGAAMVLFYGLAVVGGNVEQIGLFNGSRAAVDVGVLSSLMLPADTFYRVAVQVATGGLGDALVQTLGPVFGNLSAPSALMVVYTFAYVAAAVAAAAWIFTRRDV